MKYYLIKDEIKKGDDMPKGDKYIHNSTKYYLHYNKWIESLQLCSITENELTNIVRHLSIYDNENYNKGNPIDVTDIIESEFECGLGNCVAEDGCCISCILPKYKITFKEPTKVELSALQRHRDTWIGKSDEWLFERLNNELKSKVEEIHNLLRIVECAKADGTDIKDNKIKLLKEDLECIHLYLDDLKIPRKDSNNNDYSIVGRIKLLHPEKTNEESQEKLYDDFGKTIMHGGLNLCKLHFILARKHEYAF